jgi:signal transduction histidine kinase
LLPQPGAGGIAGGFELCLTSDQPPPAVVPGPVAEEAPRLVGREVAPALRSPIARIIATAETIRLRRAGPLDEDYARYAGEIAAAGEHLLALVEDLADLEVIEAKAFATAPDPIDLADVARRAAGILGVRARARGITLAAPAPDASLPATAEFRRALQVLLNLIGNAIHYAPEDSAIRIELARDGAMALARVIDQGPGLSAGQQARIFDKFERLGRSGDGGSGLGLYISRRLAEAMGGSLTVTSAPGEGACFILQVPAR